LSELKTVFPNASLRRGFGRQADFVSESYVDQREASRDDGPNRRPATKRKRRQTAI